jgi:hypothetical protein
VNTGKLTRDHPTHSFAYKRVLVQTDAREYATCGRVANLRCSSHIILLVTFNILPQRISRSEQSLIEDRCTSQLTAQRRHHRLTAKHADLQLMWPCFQQKDVATGTGSRLGKRMPWCVLIERGVVLKIRKYAGKSGRKGQNREAPCFIPNIFEQLS